MNQKPNVQILVPLLSQFEDQSHAAIVKMLTATQAADVLVTCHRGISVLHWMRNDLIAGLYKQNSPFTHVLFVDGDMVPPPDGLTTLLSRQVDVIGAVCTNRFHPVFLNACNFDSERRVTEINLDKPGVYKVGGIGTGFLLISRRALDAVGEYSMRQQYAVDYLGMNPATAAQIEEKARTLFANTRNAQWFEFLKNTATGKDYGEDFSFCLKARECGLDVWADATFAVGHIGQHVFSLRDYWSSTGQMRSSA